MAKTLIMVTRIVEGRDEYADTWHNGKFRAAQQSTTENGAQFFRVSFQDLTLVVLNGQDFRMNNYPEAGLTLAFADPSKKLACAICEFVRDVGDHTDIVIAIHWRGADSKEKLQEFFKQIFELDDLQCDGLDCIGTFSRIDADVLPYTIGGDWSIISEIEHIVLSLQSQQLVNFERSFNDLWDSLGTRKKIDLTLRKLLHTLFPLYIDLKGISEVFLKDPNKASEYVSEVVDGYQNALPTLLDEARQLASDLENIIEDSQYARCLHHRVQKLRQLFVDESNQDSAFSSMLASAQEGMNNLGSALLKDQAIAARSFVNWFQEVKQSLQDIQSTIAQRQTGNA